MKNCDIELLNKHFPDKQFTIDDFNNVYVSGRKHSFANLGENSHLELRTIPPFIKKSIYNGNILNIRNKILSCYSFYYYIVFSSEIPLIYKILNKIRSRYNSSYKPGPFIYSS